MDRLSIGKVLLCDLKNVGWVFLKCDFSMTSNSNIENYFYYFNNNNHKNRSLWPPIHGNKRQTL